MAGLLAMTGADAAYVMKRGSSPMTCYRTRLQIGLITAASLALLGCTTVASQAPAAPSVAVSPQPTSTVSPSSEAQASAQPVASPSPSEPPVDPTVLPSDAPTTRYGVKYVDLKVGTGATPQAGQTCVVHYTGWLKEDGKRFESSLDRGQPYEFKLATGQVIQGWDEGISTMKVGGKRKLEIPPKLAYGEQGTNGIPANATLIFDIELLAVK
jgi:peptidylprolyl isomerase